jgi:hypothetical protein
VEIHAIDAVQLAKCARWRRSAPAPSPVSARTGRQGPDAMLCIIRTVPPLPTDFSPRASLRQQDLHDESSAHQWAYQASMQPKRHAQNSRCEKPSRWRKHSRNPKGPVLGCPAAVRTMSSYHDVSRNRPTPS